MQTEADIILPLVSASFSFISLFGVAFLNHFVHAIWLEVGFVVPSSFIFFNFLSNTKFLSYTLN